MSKGKNMVGGQAVIEGVMMRGKDCIATSVRKSNGEIVTEKKYVVPFTKRNKMLSIPIVRGFVVLIESMIIGIQTLNYSASFFEEEESEPSKLEGVMQKIFKEKTEDVFMFFSLLVSFIFAMGLFLALPTIGANFFKKRINSSIALNIIEGAIRVTIFILYIYLIGKMKDINRVYQYHGAEHKSIFCYESGRELTPENAKKFSRFHPRCGTNFLFLVMIVSILIFSLTGWNSIVERMVYRIILLPLISGITYEIVRWLGKSSNKLSKILAYPGLQLQRLTTREPDLEQLEVAITALKAAEGVE
ncbi:DUF1385 domain-containing protein [Haloimpatiens massiliensis]|uniref:DUF1385 domain-containing protein n=1 Tax=Haloimpatiens massiliensis TaxID=1658110 RepID=UPI000C81FBDB|nr:DUF1385 domain-containing protein [Haloimpatiens massiliensis]